MLLSDKMIENCLNLIPEQHRSRVKVIFDVGSRDCEQSIEFAKAFPTARIFAFECNPNTIELCRQNIKEYPNITLIDKAVCDKDAECKFYPIDKDKTITSWADSNPGASSMFVANGTYPLEHYVQYEITVPGTRLDTVCKQYGIESIDLIFIDLQGSELLAFQSLGSLMSSVQYIWTEVSHRPIYTGQCMFHDVDSFLTRSGMVRRTEIHPDCWQEDVFYQRL